MICTYKAIINSYALTKLYNKTMNIKHKHQSPRQLKNVLKYTELYNGVYNQARMIAILTRGQSKKYLHRRLCELNNWKALPKHEKIKIFNKISAEYKFY